MTTFPSTMTPRRRAAPEDARPRPEAPDAPLFAEPATEPEPASYEPPADDPHTLALATFHYHGVPVQLDIRAVDSLVLASVERRIDRLLKREGWSAPPAIQAGAPARPQKPAELRQPPLYQSDGTPCCPIHKTVLQESKFGGFYCGSKADGELGNDRGYCRYTWREA